MERALSHSLASCSGLRSRAAPLARPHAAPVASRRSLACCAVLDLTRPSGANASIRQAPLSVDPAEQGGETRVVGIHSPAEFDVVVRQHANKLVVLMCKAKCCRPCKMFARKYSKIADYYSDALFFDIYGDESKETRQMMIRTGVKVTPFFALYRNGERVHGHGGVNEANLHKAIQANLLTGEAGFGSYTVAPAPKEEEEEDD